MDLSLQEVQLAIQLCEIDRKFTTEMIEYFSSGPNSLTARRMILLSLQTKLRAALLERKQEGECPTSPSTVTSVVESGSPGTSRTEAPKPAGVVVGTPRRPSRWRR